MLVRGVAICLGMRSASQGCFSNSADVGRSLGFLYENPQGHMLHMKGSVMHVPKLRDQSRTQT